MQDNLDTVFLNEREKAYVQGVNMMKYYLEMMV